MRKVLFILALLILATTLVSGAPVSAQTSAYKLTVLHTNDTHGHWEPFVVSNVSQSGIARRATLIKQLRAENPNSLLVDAGDVSQGTLYFVQYKHQEGRDFYNLLGYDVVTPGNHEFDLGPKLFADNFVTGAKFGIVNANIDFSNEPSLVGKIPAYLIKQVGGQSIGIIGMITDELPIDSNAGPNIKMKDALATAKAAVADLEKQGVNKIIMLTHRGYGADLDLAAKMDGIDLIVGGHTHSLLGDAAKLDKSFSAPVGPYPTIVKTPSGGKTIIVQDFEYGRLLGRIDLTFDDKGVVTAYEGQPIFVDKNIADDADAAKKLGELAKPLEDLKKQMVGKTSVDLIGESSVTRNQESNLGDLIADAMLWSTALDKTQVAIVNGGAMRRTIKAGDISYGDILEVLPFGNRVVQLDINGADLQAALENGISQVYFGGGSAGRFPQVAGLKFSADLGKPAGARVTDVQIGSVKNGFKPLDKTATYRIVTLDFMAGGGDGYAMLQNGKNLDGGDVPIDEVLTDYIAYLKAPIASQVEGRITLSGTPPPAPTPVPTMTPTVGITTTAAATRVVTPTLTPATPTASPTNTPAATMAISATPTIFYAYPTMPIPPPFSNAPILPRLLIPWEHIREGRDR
jgi:5'-nucleotidase / UDP-sugar diphosphatase